MFLVTMSSIVSIPSMFFATIISMVSILSIVLEYQNFDNLQQYYLRCCKLINYRKFKTIDTIAGIVTMNIDSSDKNVENYRS